MAVRRMLWPLKRSYVSASRPMHAQNVFEKLRSLRNIFKKQKEKKEISELPALPTSPLRPSASVQSSLSSSSHEATFRRARHQADQLASERLRRAEAELATKRVVDQRSIEDIVQDALQHVGLPSRDLATELADLSTKAKVLAYVSQVKQHTIPDVLLARIETGSDVVKYYHRVAVEDSETGRPKHPVAAWFSELQNGNKLPPNVVFVPYVKERGKKLNERTQSRR